MCVCVCISACRPHLPHPCGETHPAPSVHTNRQLAPQLHTHLRDAHTLMSTLCTAHQSTQHLLLACFCRQRLCLLSPGGSENALESSSTHLCQQTNKPTNQATTAACKKSQQLQTSPLATTCTATKQTRSSSLATRTPPPHSNLILQPHTCAHKQANTHSTLQGMRAVHATPLLAHMMMHRTLHHPVVTLLLLYKQTNKHLRWLLLTGQKQQLRSRTTHNSDGCGLKLSLLLRLVAA